MNEHHLRVDADLSDLVPGFLGSRRNDLSDLNKALACGDFERVARLGHNIKGVAGSYGFQRLSDLGMHLQAAALRKDRAVLESLARQMREHLDRLNITYVNPADTP